MRTRLCYFGIWILAVTIMPAIPSHSAETDAERHARIERLIEQLASPNEKPIPGDRGGEMIFPEEYDRKAQVKVVEAWKALLKEGQPAFPQLLAHADDERYCCTVRAPADQRNIDVGYVCGSIVYSNIEPYNLESMGRGGGLEGIRGNLKAWLEARKDKSLREMQLERAEDAVQQLQKRRGEGYIEEARRKNIATLTKLIADLKTRKDAMIPDGKVKHVLGL